MRLILDDEFRSPHSIHSRGIAGLGRRPTLNRFGIISIIPHGVAERRVSPVLGRFRLIHP